MRVAIYQGPELASDIPDVAANLESIAKALSDAAAEGADLMLVPELSTTGYNIGGLIADRAEPADGSIAQFLAEHCKRNRIAVVYGFPERSGADVFNSVKAIDRDGSTLGSYRKTHLFGDLDVDHFRPGAELIAQFDFDGYRCGLAICYDVEFPEVVRAHADAGTDLLLVPTGLMVPFDIVAKILVPARAYESQMYVAYANHCGTEGAWIYTGLSCIVGPDGADLARAGRGEELILADLDAGVLSQSRALNTHLRDRRTDLYR